MLHRRSSEEKNSKNINRGKVVRRLAVTVAPLAKFIDRVCPEGTVNAEMTTEEQEATPDAEDTELTVQVARFAVSAPEGIPKARWTIIKEISAVVNASIAGEQPNNDGQITRDGKE
jgi:hypothetical protein